MQLENLEGWYQLKQFGVFFLGVAVGVFCTIILFFYGCFKSTSSTRSTRTSESSNPSSDDVVESQMPPSYSSLKFDKPACKPCKCCRIISIMNCKNLFQK
ncbi:hypothetical protein L5515_002858 [Caenorhabditis briggsae]|uniref:Uncharacterized protein n=1 Tax=Caenorhabditis briggsae TaxID=6238 RepID=A0AAE9J5D5_CAEBR|nr:hypothetical protein L5515_002858 [Caenorhabditis briggsae]